MLYCTILYCKVLSQSDTALWVCVSDLEAESSEVCQQLCWQSPGGSSSCYILCVETNQSWSCRDCWALQGDRHGCCWTLEMFSIIVHDWKWRVRWSLRMEWKIVSGWMKSSCSVMCCSCHPLSYNVLVWSYRSDKQKEPAFSYTLNHLWTHGVSLIHLFSLFEIHHPLPLVISMPSSHRLYVYGIVKPLTSPVITSIITVLQISVARSSTQLKITGIEEEKQRVGDWAERV